MTAIPSAGDLTTVMAVREFLQKRSSDNDQDNVIQTLVTAASGLITRHTERQFIAEDGVAKTFEWEQPLGRPRVLSLAPYELRSVDQVRLDTDTDRPSVVDATRFRLWPRPPVDGTFLGIRLSALVPSSPDPTWGPHRTMEITGDWGLAAVPEEIANWTVLTVSIWLKRDVAAFETGLHVDEGYVERPKSLPSAVVAGLESWKRMTA